MGQPNTELSVVIPYYYASDTLGEQLAGLAAQVWDGSWEVVIADNGSDPELTELVKPYSSQLTINLVDASDIKGPAHARNVGVGAAKGDKILFADADDVVAPGWLATMAGALDAHDLVVCRMDFERLNPFFKRSGRSAHQQTGPQVYTYPKFLPHAAGTSLGIRRHAHDAVDGFDEDMFRLEDTDYCWRLQLAGFDLAFVPEAVVYYRLRGGTRDLLKQAYYYGSYNVFLYKRYQARGMPRLTVKQGIYRWYSLLRQSTQLFSASQRSNWLWKFAFRLGRVKGSIRHRVFAL